MRSVASRLWHITGIQRRVFGQRLRPFAVLAWLVFLRGFVAVTWRLDRVFHRGYARQVIDRPIFIIGNPRSGTTFLHRFLAEQGDVVGFRAYEMLVPSLTGRALIEPLLPLLGGLNPGKHHGAVAHETSFDALETDDAAMFLRFVDGVFLYGYFLCWDDPDPSELFAQFEPSSPETARDLAFYVECLKRNLHRSGKPRVLGKLFTFPPRIDDVLREFPDAKLIYMIRDPVETLPSGLSLLTGVQEQHFHISALPEASRARFTARLVTGLSLLLERFAARYAAGEIPPENLLIVRYGELMDDFEGSMAKILEFAELGASEAFRARIRDVDERQRGRVSKHEYSLEQYGLDAQQIVTELADVYRTFNLPPPPGTTLPQKTDGFGWAWASHDMDRTPFSLVLAIALFGCGEGASGDTDESSDSENSTSTETGTDGLPSVIGEPEIIKHPNQPMVVDVLVELDRPGLVELAHDQDPGVRVVSLAIEQEGRNHHLRVRGLAPGREHTLTLTLRDAGDPASYTTQGLDFSTNMAQPGFRPSFDVEVGNAATVDPGYRMFDYTYTPLGDPAGIFVIDPEGVTRWYYNGGVPGYVGVTAVWAGIDLLDDGSVLVTRDGAIIVVDELGERRVEFSASEYQLPLFRHDVERLANGNYLTLSNSFETHDYSAFGLDAEQVVAGDLLVEIDPAGEIVWTWDAFDHLDPLRLRSNPAEGLLYFDPGTGKFGYDWTHGNGMIELADQGLILLCLRHQNWIVAIDHATGEVAWRFGPEGDFELLDGTWFYHPHSPQMQSDGSLLLYDNAIGNPEQPDNLAWSRAVRYAIDFEAMTATQVWDSRRGEPYVSPVAGDADRMASGNILVLDSALQPDPAAFDLGKNYSRLVELPSEGEAGAIWSLTTKAGSYVYRATSIGRLPGAMMN